MTNVAVLGAGAGGLTIAGDLTLAGHRVNLFELPKFRENLKPIEEKGGVEVKGERINQGLAKLNKITTDVGEAVSDVEVVFIVVPCYGHRVFAEEVFPHLKEGQVVCYLGEGGGSLEFNLVSKEKGGGKNIILGETNTLPYGARIVGPATVESFRKIGGTLAAALPSKNNEKLLRVLKSFWPYIEEAEDVFETILLNFNAIDHVATFVLNWGRLEGGSGRIRYWGEGATPSVARVIEAVDNEILEIRKAWGLKNQTPYRDWLVKQGLLDSPKPTTYEAIHSSKLASVTFTCGPEAPRHRYITEDVPYALVLISSIGDLVGVETPVIDSIITLVSAATGVDYWKEGRTISKLSLAGMDKESVRRFIREGIM